MKISDKKNFISIRKQSISIISLKRVLKKSTT